MVRRGRGPRSHRKLASRTNREWFGRSALAVGLLALGFLSTSSSIAHVVAKVDPAQANALAPGNGRILAKYAEDVFTRTLSTDPNSLSGNLARRALQADPTAVEALTVLGFQAELRGNTSASDRIFSYSVALSRRELRPQIWAIERAVTEGDIAGALRSYDIALRTSKDAPQDLYPILAAALSEPRIRSELLDILASHPVWEESFIAYAANSGIEPEGAISFFKEGREIGLKVTDDLRVSLVNALISQNRLDSAWTYYRSFRNVARRDRSRDPEFALKDENRALFDWRAGESTRLSVAILRQGKGGRLDFSVPPSVGGVLVSQAQLLPAGAYRLEGQSAGLDQPDHSKPYWTLICHDGRELGRIPLQNSKADGGRFTGRFTVPQGCGMQTLSLVARPSDDISGVAGQISMAQLVPAR